MKIVTINNIVKLILCTFLLFLLTSCNPQASSNTPVADQPATAVIEDDLIVNFETESVYFTQEELFTQADLIFAGKVLGISPTHWNQDSGEYWRETTEEGTTATGEKLTTTHSAWPVYEVRLSVTQPIVDKLGVDHEVVLTLLGKSPVDNDILNSGGESVQVDAESVNLQNGQELIIFAMQTELAWRNPDRPIELTTTSDGTASYFDIGDRTIVTLMGMYDNAYLVKKDDGLYYPVEGASNRQEPLSLDSLIQNISK